MENLIIKEEAHWLYISLNRPGKKNALDLSLIENLIEVLSSVSKKPHIVGIHLTGEGSCFCAGADLNWMHDHLKDSHLLFDLFQILDETMIPIIAHAQGSIYGGGIGLISVCDFISVDTKTHFCFSELQLGLVPACITPFILKKIHLSQARYLILSSKLFDAKEAKNQGLVHYIGTDKDCLQWRKNKIEKLNTVDLTAFKKTKKMFQHFHQVGSFKNFCIQLLDEQRQDPSTKKKILNFLNKNS